MNWCLRLFILMSVFFLAIIRDGLVTVRPTMIEDPKPALWYTEDAPSVQDRSYLILVTTRVKSMAQSRTWPDRGCSTFAWGVYTDHNLNEEPDWRALKQAKKYLDLVCGFLGKSRITSDPNFLHFRSTARRDWVTISPEEAIIDRGADIIVVGDGIIRSANQVKRGVFYKERHFLALVKRVGCFYNRGSQWNKWANIMVWRSS